jgi:hypothetical protein
MKSIKRMIDSALTVCQSKSAIARTLGVTPQRFWQFESGLRHMPASLVMRLATLANMNAVIELGRYEAEWCGKKTMRAAAGIAGAAFTLGALSLAHGDVQASVSIPCYAVDPLHIMRRTRAWLLRLFGSARGARTPSAPLGLPYIRPELGFAV